MAIVIRVFAALGLLFALALPALTKDARIGTSTINLTLPSGYCELVESQPGDARMLSTLKDMLTAAGNQLLSISADCQQLSEWRTGKRSLLDDTAQYQTLISLINADAPKSPDEAVKQTCASMREEGEKMLTEMLPDVRSRAERMITGLKVNEMRFLGIVAEEPNACYAAMLQKFRTQVGTDKTQITVFVTTYVKGKIVYYYLFSPYVNANTITTMLAKHKSNLTAFQGANRN
jgi:hypothetical protein